MDSHGQGTMRARVAVTVRIVDGRSHGPGLAGSVGAIVCAQFEPAPLYVRLWSGRTLRA